MRGFSLLELMIVLLVTAILLALAVPSYQRYVLRGHRAEAVRALLSAAACQERLRAAEGHYDTTRCGDAGVDGYYTVRIEPAGTIESDVFRAIAEPLRPRAGDPCGSLALDQAGRRSIGGDAASLSACWGGR